MFAGPCFPLLQAKNAWVTFIKNCEVLNVNEVSSLNPPSAAAATVSEGTAASPTVRIPLN